jgi:hypothetical protein
MRSVIRLSWTLAFGTIVGFLALAVTPVSASPILLEQRVDQLDFFTSPTPTVVNSVFGKFSVTALGDASTVEYLNLVARDGFGVEHWLVQNFPILPLSINPTTTTFTTAFDLSPFVTDGMDLTSLDYGTVVSPTVATSAPTVAFTTQVVGDALLDAKGKNNGTGTTAAAPATPSTPQTVTFDTPFVHLRYRPGFPNVEQDTDECGPGAAANSLQWLKDKQGLKITDTLDDRLDDLVTRMNTNRPAEAFVDGSHGQPMNGQYDLGEDFTDTNGNGVYDDAKPGTEDADFINGKLAYEDAKKVDLDVKFMDDELGGSDIELKPGGPKATGRGTKPNAKFIFDELNADEDVEIGMTFVVPEAFVDGSNGLPMNGMYDFGEDFTDVNGNGVYDQKVLDGGHWITAVGKINLFGALGIWFVEDQRQGQDTDEPFVDGSNGQPMNGKYDAGEDFTDSNGNGRWDDSGTKEVGFTWLGLRDDGFFDGYLTLLGYPGDEVVDIVVSESVPEPATLGLFGSGLLTVLLRARRNRHV